MNCHSEGGKRRAARAGLSGLRFVRPLVLVRGAAATGGASICRPPALQRASCGPAAVPGASAHPSLGPWPRAARSARRFDHHCRRARPARHLTAGWCSIPLAAGAPALQSTSAGAPERLPPAVLRRHMCGTLDQRAKAAMSDKADKMQRARGAPRARRWRTPQAVTSWWRC